MWHLELSEMKAEIVVVAVLAFPNFSCLGRGGVGVRGQLLEEGFRTGEFGRRKGRPFVHHYSISIPP